MKMKITDGMKHDLARVVCDRMACLGRSEFGFCYDDDFKRCPYYSQDGHNYSDADMRVYRSIKSMIRDERKV